MNFTWFSSAYNTDNALYRVAVFVQMTGVLIIAAGIPHDLHFDAMAVGYVVMRLALVAQWLRAAASSVEGRAAALRYAVGITVVQIGWLALLALPDNVGLGPFFFLAAAELVVPLWAEAAGRTPWHPRHIAERYGLFTIIVLGESILAATVGVQVALSGETTTGHLVAVVVGGLAIVFSMWWLYFDMPAVRIVEKIRDAFSERLSGAFKWGYGHYVVFASAVAVGAGLAVAVDQVTSHSQLTDQQAGLAVTVPAAVYLLAVWALHARYAHVTRLRTFAVPVAAALVVASSVTPQPVLATGVLLAALVVVNVTTSRSQAPQSPRRNNGVAPGTYRRRACRQILPRRTLFSISWRV